MGWSSNDSTKGKGKLDLFVNDPLRLFRFDAPMGQIFFNHFFQIVDVIEVDVIHVVDVGIDVSGDRDVNEEHRPVFAAFKTSLMSRARIMLPVSPWS